MTITNWRPAQGGGARKGSFDVTTPSGFTFRKCSLMSGSNGDFINLPSEKFQGSDGSTKYAALVKIEDKEKKAKFDAAVIEALRAAGHHGGNGGEW